MLLKHDKHAFDSIHHTQSPLTPALYLRGSFLPLSIQQVKDHTIIILFENCYLNLTLCFLRRK